MSVHGGEGVGSGEDGGPHLPCFSPNSTPPPSHTHTLEVFTLVSPRRCWTSARWPPPTFLLIDPALCINLLPCRSIYTSSTHIKPLYQQSPAVILAIVYLTQPSVSVNSTTRRGLFFPGMSNCRHVHKSLAAVLCKRAAYRSCSA